MTPKRPLGSAFRTGRRRRDEDGLQEAIVDFHAISVINAASAILFAVPNGEKREAVTAARLTGISAAARLQLPPEDALKPFGLGVLPGAPDLILLTAHACTDLVEVKRPEQVDPLGIDAKRPAGRLQKTQKLFRAGAERLDHHYWVVDSLEAYAAILELRRIALRVRL